MRTVCLAVWAVGVVLGQSAEEPVILTIDVENHVLYRGNVFDATKLAKDPGLTTSVNQAFISGVNVGDIVAVNERPTKGLWAMTFSVATPFRAQPGPGQLIADVNASATFQCVSHILSADGTYIGTITDTGADPAPGHVIIGGSGAFFGVTGEQRMVMLTGRQASTAEDPSLRRVNGGSKARFIFYLYPRFRPAVQITPAGPAVFHEDYSPVTSAKPAREGELLIVAARNLGPTRPDLLPPGTRQFRADPLEVVNSPVEVAVNGNSAEVISKVGWPETSDLYHVVFRVPSGLRPGMATLQLTSAWIPGPLVEIPAQ